MKYKVDTQKTFPLKISFNLKPGKWWRQRKKTIISFSFRFYFTTHSQITFDECIVSKKEKRTTHPKIWNGGSHQIIQSEEWLIERWFVCDFKISSQLKVKQSWYYLQAVIRFIVSTYPCDSRWWNCFDCTGRLTTWEKIKIRHFRKQFKRPQRKKIHTSQSILTHSSTPGAYNLGSDNYASVTTDRWDFLSVCRARFYLIYAFRIWFFMTFFSPSWAFADKYVESSVTGDLSDKVCMTTSVSKMNNNLQFAAS